MSTSVREDEDFVFSISPNPVAGVLYVTLDKAKPLTCIMSNVSGITVHHSKHLERTIDIDINDLQSGIYFITIVDSEGRRVSHKFIKI